MSRKAKIVIDADGLDRREAGYYSTPSFVANFLARKLLAYRPGARSVLDPCVGKGELAEPFSRAGLEVIGIDIADRQPRHCSKLIVSDFLEMAADASSGYLFLQRRIPSSDIIVANPPYNCHESDYIRSRKARLIKSFGKAAALNMYSLFIKAIIECAQEGVFIGLIVHDSFLTAVGYRELREYVLENCVIRNLHLCPTSLFADQGADVRTCLLILEKKHPTEDSNVQISNREATVAEFQSTLALERFSRCRQSSITLSGRVDNREIVVGLPPALAAVFAGRRLGQVAPCVTGISTGNDAKYLRPVKQAGFSVPFYKNPASRRFFAEPDGFLIDDYDRESRSVANFMIRNRELLPKGGLSCSSMGVAFGATVRPPNTLCGVNPNVIVGESDKWWLLAYLNSRVCLYLLRGALIRSNMVTAGYASRIPVPDFDDQTKAALGKLAHTSYKNAFGSYKNERERTAIDGLVESALALDATTTERLATFSLDPTRLT